LFFRYSSPVVDGAIERRLRELLCNNARHEFATLAIEAYGPELYGFLVHVLDGAPSAAEVLAQSIEAFWCSLPEFRAACSVRTWLYLLARRSVRRYMRRPWNRRPHTGDQHLDELVAFAHSRTAPWQRTTIKARFRDLREKLSPEDRILLVLRIDRDMEWGDIAQVTLGATAAGGNADELAREATRLRKRFQLIKTKLRKQARDMGLLGSA
jgi:RNA polymerase sigma-70 factor (ECF subfamily)